MIKGIIIGFLVVAAVVALAEYSESTPVVTVEVVTPTGPVKYVPPEWVTNEQGQRCIKQGTTVTCG